MLMVEGEWFYVMLLCNGSNENETFIIEVPAAECYARKEDPLPTKCIIKVLYSFGLALVSTSRPVSMVRKVLERLGQYLLVAFFHFVTELGPFVAKLC